MSFNLGPLGESLLLVRIIPFMANDRREIPQNSLRRWKEKSFTQKEYNYFWDSQHDSALYPKLCWFFRILIKHNQPGMC